MDDLETARQARFLLVMGHLMASLGDERGKEIVKNLEEDGLSMDELKRASLPGVELDD